MAGETSFYNQNADNNMLLNLSGLTPAVGDLLVCTAAGVWSLLAPGSNGQVLELIGGVPAWGSSAGGGSPGGTSGELQVNSGGSFGGMPAVNGDGTLNTTSGALVVTKTNGAAFAASATTDATNANNIVAGTLPVARLSLFGSAVNGIVSASGGGTTNFLRADGSWAPPPSGGGAPLLLNFGTITANPAEPSPGMGLSIEGTWNNAAVTFDAPFFMNITNTASNAASQLLDLQVGGGSQFLVNVGGNVSANGNITLFGSTVNWNNDTNLSRLSAGILGLSNLTAATTFQVYNTTDSKTSPTNYERGVFDWTTTLDILTIGMQAGGTGSNRQVNLVAPGSGLYLCGSKNSQGGIFFTNSGNLGAGAGAPIAMNFNDGEMLVLASATQLKFSASGSISGGGWANDFSLGRDAAGILGISQDHNAAPCGLRVYNNNDFAGNSEVGVFDWTTTANVLTIGTQAAGTGTQRPTIWVGNAFTVATLPAASSNKYARAIVSDASSPTFGSTVTGGSSTVTPVYSDGTNWKVG